MKKLTPFLIWVMLLLYACVPVVQTSEPFQTRTPFTPTPRPTETPTVVPTATEIPDPTMPLGEVGKDAEGTYVKMENGDIARKVEYKNSKGEILYEGWAVEKTQKGGIPLMDFREHNLIPTRLYVASDVLGGHGVVSLTHTDNIEQTITRLGTTVIAEIGIRKKINLFNPSESEEFVQKLFVEDVTLPFITSKGESVEGILGPDTGFITIVVPFDSLVPTAENGVTEWLDPYHESRSSFRSTVLGVDSDGNIIGLIASKKPLNELPDKLIRALALFHAANIIKEEDQTIQEFTSILQIFVQYADAIGDKKVPDIIITRTP